MIKDFIKKATALFIVVNMIIITIISLPFLLLVTAFLTLFTTIKRKVSTKPNKSSGKPSDKTDSKIVSFNDAKEF